MKEKVDAILFETAVKKEEILGVLNICEKNTIPCVISFYINELWYIPDPDWYMTLDDMIQYINTHTIYSQKKYGINCAEKTSIMKACSEAQYAKDQIQVIYPNASHHTACAYNTAHKEGDDITTFIQKMQNILPKMDTIWWCCGHTPSDIVQLRKAMPKK